MNRARFAAGALAALGVVAAGGARADFWGGRFVRTTMLVPKNAPQSSPAPSAPRSRPVPQSRPAPPPHSSVVPPQHRPFAHGQGAFPHHRAFPHYRPYYAPPIIVPRYIPPPAYYGYGPVPYVAPPPVYYDYRPPVYVTPPPVYVERDDGYWYYCTPLGAYYPDVTECPEPWVPVPPR